MARLSNCLAPDALDDPHHRLELVRHAHESNARSEDGAASLPKLIAVALVQPLILPLPFVSSFVGIAAMPGFAAAAYLELLAPG